MEDKVRWHTQDMMRGKLIRASNMASNKQPQEVNSIINNTKKRNRSIRHMVMSALEEWSGNMKLEEDVPV